MNAPAEIVRNGEQITYSEPLHSLDYIGSSRKERIFSHQALNKPGNTPSFIPNTKGNFSSKQFGQSVKFVVQLHVRGLEL